MKKAEINYKGIDLVVEGKWVVSTKVSFVSSDFAVGKVGKYRIFTGDTKETGRLVNFKVLHLGEDIKNILGNNELDEIVDLATKNIEKQMEFKNLKISLK